MTIETIPVCLGERQVLEISALTFFPFRVSFGLHFPMGIKQRQKKIQPPPGMFQVPSVAFEAMQHGAGGKYGAKATEVLRVGL